MKRLFLKIFLGVLLTILFTFFVGMQIAFWIMPRPPMFPAPPSHGHIDGPRRERMEEPRRDRIEGAKPGDADGLEGGPRHGSRHGPPLGAMLDPIGMGPGPRNLDEEWRIRMGDLLELHAYATAELTVKEGPEAALEEMDRLGGAWGVETYLLDESGRDVRGRETPESVKDAAGSIVEDGVVERSSTERNITLAMRFRDGDGRPYVFAADTQMKSPPPRSFFASITLLRLAAVAIGLGLVCFFLASHITKPVLRMRSAMRRFGEGDLKQRVGESVGRRRDEIGELARDFDHMAEQIATLLGSQRRLLQDISHELRSPLARQRVALELARQANAEDITKALDRAEREAERLDALIGELLTLTRMESNSEGTARTPTDIARLVREVIDNAEFESSNGARSVKLTKCEACKATAAPELLHRAIENVVRNALAYTADGTTVEASLEVEGGEAVIRVRDFGPGVPEGELADIFRPFYRVSHARDRKSGGVGLGLSIADRAVRLHGGEISAARHAEGGLAVTIRIPREEGGGAKQYGGATG